MKHLSLCLGGLLAASVTHAQVGVRVGGNIANLRTSTGDLFENSASSRSGYQVGLFYQVPLTSWLSVLPEAQYSRERQTLSQTSYAIWDGSISRESRQYMSYLNVPVLLRATLGPVYLEAGPQGGFLLGGRQEGFTRSYSSWARTVTYEALQESPAERFRRVDVGACVGLGARLPAGLGVSLRAYQGLVSLTSNARTGEGTLYRQQVQASLTYQLAAR